MGRKQSAAVKYGLDIDAYDVLSRALENFNRYNTEGLITMADLARIWKWQEGLCAGTGHPLRARGINACKMLRVDPDGSMGADNTVLVTKIYADARRLNGKYGSEGHAKVAEWFAAAAAYAKAHPDIVVSDSVGDPTQEEDLDDFNIVSDTPPLAE